MYMYHICISMFLYASQCIHMHPSRIHMQPKLHTPPLRIRTRIFKTYFRQNVKKSKNRQNHKILIAIRSVKSVRIQPNTPNRVNIGKH